MPRRERRAEIKDMRRLEFFFDVVCPFAYLASHKVARLAAERAIEVSWRPVLLGGLYAATKAPQGKDGSASDVMPAAKKALFQQDLVREAERGAVTLNWNPKHPCRSVNALRLVQGAPAARRAAVAQVCSAIRRKAVAWMLARTVTPARPLAVLLAASFQIVLGGRR